MRLRLPLIRTDHYILKYLLEKRLTTSPQQHWIGKLLSFDFKVEYKARAVNRAANELSRREEEVGQLIAISQPNVPFLMQHEVKLKGSRSCNACKPR